MYLATIITNTDELTVTQRAFNTLDAARAWLHVELAERKAAELGVPSVEMTQKASSPSEYRRTAECSQHKYRFYNYIEYIEPA